MPFGDDPNRRGASRRWIPQAVEGSLRRLRLTGKYRKGQEISGPGGVARQQRFAAVFDATAPENAAKLDAADALGAFADEAGMTLIQMAIVPPCHSINVADHMWSTSTPALEAASRRR